MHTKSLVTLKQMLIERAGRKKAATDRSPAGPAKPPVADGETSAVNGKNGGKNGEIGKHVDSAAIRPSPASDKLEKVASYFPDVFCTTWSACSCMHGTLLVASTCCKRALRSAGMSGVRLSRSMMLYEAYTCLQEYIELKDGVVPLHVKEQRLSNLLQALLIGACVAATPVVRRIPKSVLWGYFAYMALESLPGSEFWDRILLLLTDRHKRCAAPHVYDQ